MIRWRRNLKIQRRKDNLLSLKTLLHQREQELARINSELIVTNSGIVALFNELEDKTKQLQATEQILRTRNEALKGFAYTVSHDLKAPLRSISGYTQEIRHKQSRGLNERALFCLSQILVATHHLDLLIEALLHYARLDVALPVFSEVKLDNMISSLLNDRSLLIAKSQAEITTNLGFTMLLTWESGIQQVLSNLIDNALKYSSKACPPRLDIETRELDSSWQLIVGDNGIGFDMQYHDRIFGLFNRLVRAEDYEGTGVGLTIAKKVLDSLGGSIKAEAQIGLGARFIVELPKNIPGV